MHINKSLLLSGVIKRVIILDTQRFRCLNRNITPLFVRHITFVDVIVVVYIPVRRLFTENDQVEYLRTVISLGNDNG